MGKQQGAGNYEVVQDHISCGKHTVPKQGVYVECGLFNFWTNYVELILKNHNAIITLKQTCCKEIGRPKLSLISVLLLSSLWPVLLVFPQHFPHLVQLSQL